MANDWSIRKRRPVRRKQIAPLLTALESAINVNLNVDGAFLEMAEFGPWELVFINKTPIAIKIENDEGKPFVFLTLRGFVDHQQAKQWVNVDHGAIPFLMNGADCMIAGVHAADEKIRAGDLVWIRDMVHQRPLAIGWSLMDSQDLVEQTKGKGIKTIHWVGDELWNME